MNVKIKETAKKPSTDLSGPACSSCPCCPDARESATYSCQIRSSDNANKNPTNGGGGTINYLPATRYKLKLSGIFFALFLIFTTVTVSHEQAVQMLIKKQQQQKKT